MYNGVIGGREKMNKKLTSFIKFLCIVYLAVYIPQIISNKDKNKEINNTNSNYITGMENLIKNKRKFSWMQNKKFVLFCDENQKDQLISNKKFFSDLQFKIEKIFVVNNIIGQTNTEQNKKNLKFQILTWNEISKKNFSNTIKNIDGIIFDVKNNGIRGDTCFNSS